MYRTSTLLRFLRFIELKFYNKVFFFHKNKIDKIYKKDLFIKNFLITFFFFFFFY
jgi:hypothetical protein